MPAAREHQDPNPDADPPAGQTTYAELRVLVVDDHPAVRMGLRGLLGDQPDFTVVDAVASAKAALSVAEHERIDVAIATQGQVGSPAARTTVGN